MKITSLVLSHFMRSWRCTRESLFVCFRCIITDGVSVISTRAEVSHQWFLSVLFILRLHICSGVNSVRIYRKLIFGIKCRVYIFLLLFFVLRLHCALDNYCVLRVLFTINTEQEKTTIFTHYFITENKSNHKPKTEKHEHFKYIF